MSVNENGDRNEDYAVYDFRPDGRGRGNFTEVGRYYGFEHQYVQNGEVRAHAQIPGSFSFR